MIKLTRNELKSIVGGGKGGNIKLWSIVNEDETIVVRFFGSRKDAYAEAASLEEQYGGVFTVTRIRSRRARPVK